jgi:hypothetical protein
MPLSIILRLDAETAGTIDAMAHHLPDRLDDPRHTYPPHLKLAMFGDAVDAADVDAALAATTGRWSALPITLACVGILPSDPAIIGLLPIPTADLLNRHATLHRALADLPTHPAYEVDGWMPHVAVTTTYLPADTVEVLSATWTGPLVGWLDAVDLVQFNPVRVLSRRPLRV